MAFGVTDEGFVLKRLADVRDSMRTRLREAFGEGIRLDAKSVFGRLEGLMSAAISEVWEATAANAVAADPAQADGVHLENHASVQGLTKLGATFSTAAVELRGTPATTIPAGSQISQKTSGTLWDLDAEVTLDGSGEGQGTVTAVEAGVKAAPGGTSSTATLTVIETAVSGWDEVWNPLDADVGREIETTTELRQRLRTDVAAAGGGTEPALVTALRQLDDVTDAKVIANLTGAEDADGRPAWSVEILVDGGDDTEIAEMIWAKKSTTARLVNAESVVTAGDSVSVSVLDSSEESKTVIFSRPELVDVFVDVVCSPDALTDAAKTTLQESIAAYSTTLQKIGADVVHYKLFSYIIGELAEQGYDELDDVDVTIGTSSPPASTDNLTITDTQRAKIETANVRVNP